MEKDTCRRCGCKWNTACVDEMYGSCWWVDKNRTLCSHCFYGFNDSKHYASSLPRKYKHEDLI